MAVFADSAPPLTTAAHLISRLGDEANATLDTARRKPHRQTRRPDRPRHARRTDQILGRLPQLLRDHALPPFSRLCDGRVSAESGIVAAVKRRGCSQPCARTHNGIRKARACRSLLLVPMQETQLLPVRTATDAGCGGRARSTCRFPRHRPIPFVWCNARQVLVRAQSVVRTGFRDGNEGVRFFVVALRCMGIQHGALKRPIGRHFRTITPACLPGSIRSYGAKLRQKIVRRIWSS